MFEAIIYVLEGVGRGIIKQMGVNVERELDGAVPGQILDALKRCAAEDKLGYICMSELMGRKMKIERCAVAPERHFIPKLQTDADLFSVRALVYVTGRTSLPVTASHARR